MVSNNKQETLNNTFWVVGLQASRFWQRSTSSRIRKWSMTYGWLRRRLMMHARNYGHWCGHVAPANLLIVATTSCAPSLPSPI
jgi:hypothetical protein